MTTALDDLIARLEAASEGSRELDAEISAALHICPPQSPDWLRNWDGPYVVFGLGRVAVQHSNCERGVNWLAPNFTTSLDAALTLVPEGYDYGFSFSKQHGLEAWVQKPFKQSECFQGYAPDGDMTNKTSAKSVCVAALKARGEP